MTTATALPSTIEYLGGNSTRRGYHTANYIITADTFEQAEQIAREYLTTVGYSAAYVSPQQRPDGRWNVRWEADSGD